MSMIPEPLPTDLVARSWPGESSSADAASFNGCVSRLDHVDLSLSLSRDLEEVRLAAAQKRLLHLRLVLAGLIGDGALGPPVCVVFRRGTPRARAVRSSGWSGGLTPGTCAWRSLPPRPTTKSGTTSWPASTPSFRAGAAWR